MTNQELNKYFVLLLDCPKHKEHQACPFKEILKVRFEARMEWFKHLNREQKEKLIRKHLICYRELELIEQ